MSYNFVAANSQVLTTVPTGISFITPITVACWFRVSTAVSSVGRGLFNAVLTSSTGAYYRLIIPGGLAVMRVNQSGITSDTAANTVIANTWMHTAGVFSSSSSRTIYLSGTSPVTGTQAALAVSSVNEIRIGATPTQFHDGLIAEFGLWTTALTASEISSLAMGISPAKIRPQSLAFYSPLVRDLIDVRGGLPITNNNNATVADHPRIYY